jgi:phosphoserine phosphatase
VARTNAALFIAPLARDFGWRGLLEALLRVAMSCYDEMMETITEIEDAIEKLPYPQVEELAAWIEAFRARRAAPPGVTTENIMALTRGEE